jgi:dihydroflavonol-4-reductase
VARLLEKGAHVRVLARSRTKALELTRAGAEIVVGDINDRQSLREAVEGVAVVFHLAGRLFIPGVPHSEYQSTHVEGTKALLDACRKQSSLERFVHCSTTGVLGATGEQPADEAVEFRPTNVYEATKAEAETAVREAWRVGFPAVIVRPGLVYGPGDLHLFGFFKSVLQHQFRPIGRRPVWLHPIYIDDISEAFLRCAEHPAASGECFHVAGREPVTLADLAGAIARAAGTNAPAGYIPVTAARAVAAFGDLLPAGVRHFAPLTSARLDFLTHSRVYSTAKAQRLLDFTAATDLATGIARTLAWYRQQGHLSLAAPAAPAYT